MSPDAPSARLVSCLGVAADLPLLPHFLRHYRGLGIAPERMHLILHADDPAAPELAAARKILSGFGVAPADTWIGPYTSDAMWQRRRAVQSAHAAPGDWVLSADLDEFHVYPEPLPRFLARLGRMGVSCAQGPFLDRLAPGGRLVPVAPEPDLWRQFPVEAEAIWSLAGQGEHHGCHGTVKLMAMRGHVLPSRGGHHPLPGQRGVRHLYGAPLGDFGRIGEAGIRFALPLQVHHFAWTAARPETLRRRLATPGVSAAGREYGRKVLAHIEAHGGLALDRLPIRQGAPRLSWMWQVRRLRAAARLSRLGRRLRPAMIGQSA